MAADEKKDGEKKKDDRPPAVKAASGMWTVVVVLIILVLGFSVIAELIGEFMRALNNTVAQVGMGVSYLSNGIAGVDSSMSIFLQKFIGFGIKLLLLYLGFLILKKLFGYLNEKYGQ